MYNTCLLLEEKYNLKKEWVSNIHEINENIALPRNPTVFPCGLIDLRGCLQSANGLDSGSFFPGGTIGSRAILN